MSGRRSLVSGLESMGEHELVDLLSQYEADEKFGGNLSPSLSSKMVHKTHSRKCSYLTLLSIRVYSHLCTQYAHEDSMKDLPL